MRDIVLTAIAFGALPFILFRPHIGVLMYVWFSVMSPHRLTWGFAHDFGFAAIIAIATLLGALFTRNRAPYPVNALSASLLLFVSWTAVSTVFALYPAASYDTWVTLMKTQLMALMIPVLFRTKEDLRLLVWVIVLSLAYYGTKGGVFTLLTGGLYKVYGPENSYIEDNNALAVALIMTMPFIRYLQLTEPRHVVRYGLLAMLVLEGIAVLGTYSRGALLAMSAMLAFLWLKGRHKGWFLLIAVLVVPFALLYMPERWYQRMDTISTYQSDSSANMRLNAWGTMLNIAKDRPLVGAGFEVAQKSIYDQYSPDSSYPPQVAHSIYFEALGSHGFVGLGLYLALLGCYWRTAGEFVRKAKGQPLLAWAAQYGRMSQVSLIGFAVGGAFLSLLNFDVPYYFVGAMLAMRRIVDAQLACSEPQDAYAAVATGPRWSDTSAIRRLE